MRPERSTPCDAGHFLFRRGKCRSAPAGFFASSRLFISQTHGASVSLLTKNINAQISFVLRTRVSTLAAKRILSILDRW